MEIFNIDYVTDTLQNPPPVPFFSYGAITGKLVNRFCQRLKGLISRAKKVLQSGFDPGIPVRHKKLNRSDEQTRESWILELIDLGETVYTTTLIQLVCFMFSFIIF